MSEKNFGGNQQKERTDWQIKHAMENQQPKERNESFKKGFDAGYAAAKKENQLAYLQALGAMQSALETLTKVTEEHPHNVIIGVDASNLTICIRLLAAAIKAVGGEE